MEAQLTLEFLPPLRPDCEEQLRCTPCSGVDGDLSEEWSEPFSTMVSPSGFCGVGERDLFRRIGEQAGVLRFELLAVLQGGGEKAGVGGQSLKAKAGRVPRASSGARVRGWRETGGPGAVLLGG